MSEAVSNYNTSSKRLSKLTSEIDEEIKKKGWLAKEVDNLKCEYNDRIKERHKRYRLYRHNFVILSILPYFLSQKIINTL